MKILPWEKEGGQTLIAALLILVLIVGIGVSLVREMMTEAMINRNLKIQRKLLYLAEAGQAYARAHFNRDFAWLPDESCHELAAGEGFILALEFTPQGVVVTSVGKIGKKELAVEAEYIFKVDEEAFQYSLLSAGRIRLSWQEDLFLQALLAHDDVILLGEEGIAHLHVTEGVYAGGEIFLAETISCNYSDLWSQQKKVNIPRIDWAGLREWARKSGTFLPGSRANEVFNPAMFGPYFIDGDLLLEDREEVFLSSGIVAVAGDLYCHDSCLELEEDLPILLLVGGNVEIENSTNSGGFKGLLAAEGQIRIKNMLYFDGFLISDDSRQGIYVEKANYIISNLWEDVGYGREDVFLPDKVELLWWKEGPLQ